MPPRGQPPSGSRKSSDRDRILQSFVQAIRHTPRGTWSHHAPLVASRETHPKISNSKIPHRVIKVLGLPYPFPTSVKYIQTLNQQKPLDRSPHPVLLPHEQSISRDLMIPTLEPILASDKHHSTCNGPMA
jgi:hypothetical protein